MAEALLDEAQALESTTVGIYRTATVIKGGRRFSFGALVVVGDRNGTVGIGYGKAPGVPAAIEKAQKDARKKLRQVTLAGGTLPHTVNCRFGASIVRLVPASPGTGVIAGATVRAVLELAGIRDCLTKAFGSSNQKNLCRATFEGLLTLRTREQIEKLRGVELGPSAVEQMLKASGQDDQAATAVTAKGPQSQATSGRGQPRRGGRKGPRQQTRHGPPAAPQAAAPAEQAAAPVVESHDAPPPASDQAEPNRETES